MALHTHGVIVSRALDCPARVLEDRYLDVLRAYLDRAFAHIVEQRIDWCGMLHIGAEVVHAKMRKQCKSQGAACKQGRCRRQDVFGDWFHSLFRFVFTSSRGHSPETRR